MARVAAVLHMDTLAALDLPVEQCLGSRPFGAGVHSISLRVDFAEDE